MVCVCYGLWLQRLHMFLGLAAARREDAPLLSRRVVDSTVQLGGSEVCRHCWLLAWRRTRAPWVASDSAGGHLPTLPPAGPDNTACLSVPCRPKNRQDKESGAVLMRGDREDSSSIGSQIAKEGNVNIVSWMRRQECGNVGGESTVWKGRWGRSCRRKRKSYVIKCG